MGHSIACVLCVLYDACACVEVCGGLCICVLEPHITLVFFFVLLCFTAAAAVMSSVSHRASSSQALYYVAAAVQQQSNSEFVWITSIHACVDIAYAWA